MTAHRHKNRRIDAQLLTDRRPQAAPNGAAGLDGCKNVPGQVQLPDGLPVPVPCGGVVELGGGGDGVFRPGLAGEEVAQQVRRQQQLIRHLQSCVALPLPPVELIEGVEGQSRINTAASVKDIGGNPLRYRVNVRLHAQPVGPWNSRQMAVSVQQAVVHAPGIDAEGVQLPIAPLPEGQEALLQLAVEIGYVPIKDPVHLHVVVLKPVQLRHGQPFTVELPQDRPAVAGAQIKGNHVSCLAHNVLPRLLNPNSQKLHQKTTLPPVHSRRRQTRNVSYFRAQKTFHPLL